MALSEEEAENDPEAAAEEGVEEIAEENKNIMEYRDEAEEEEEEKEAEKEDEEEIKEAEKEEETHPNAQQPANDAVRTLDAQILKHQGHRRVKIQKKYNASHRVVVFKKGDFATLAIPKEDRVPTDSL